MCGLERGASAWLDEARGYWCSKRAAGSAAARRRFADRNTGELVDNGQHVLLGCYTDTFAFLREIGAEGHVAWQRALQVTMIDRAGRRSRLECPDLPPPLHLLAGVFDWDALSWSDRLSILRLAGPLRTARRALKAGATAIAASPGETVENWLIRNGQTARLREMLWEPLALAALNQPMAHAAAPVFSRVLAEMFGSDPRAASIVLPTRPLHLMYAEPARAYIEQRGGEVRTGSPATIDVRGGRVDGVTAGAETWRAPRVISAVPWFALSALVAGDREAIEPLLSRAAAMESSPIVSVHLWFDRPILDEPFIGLPGRTMQWIFDKRSTDAASPGAVSLVSSGAAALVDWTNEELIATAREELAGALPAARGATLVRATIVREPRATFSLAPGQPARPGPVTPIPGFFLAGDWTDTGLPATIEGAVRSGHAAAAMALAS